MKKLLLLSFTLLGFAFASNAQEISKNAIGLRLGDSDGRHIEISYQRALGDANRLELGLGFGERHHTNHDILKFTGLYQWVFPIEGNFNWYVGAGGGLASESDNYPNDDDYDDTFIFLAGDIGIEYHFDFPLLLSLDFRPELGFGDDRYYGGNRYDNNDLDFDIAVGARFQF